MPSTFALFSYLSVALAVVTPVLGASPTIRARDGLSFNPQGIQPKPLTAVVPRAPLPVPQTNAERMKRGLNPMMPKRLVHAGRSLHARQSATPCTPYNGVIKASYVDSVSGNNVENYIAATPNPFAEYGETEDIEDALHITFCASPDSPFEIHATNDITTYPLLGLIQGFTDDDASIKTGSSNYLVFGGVSHTDAYAEPSTDGGNSFYYVTDIPRGAESTVWYLDQGSLELTVQWINPDGSSPDAVTGYLSTEAAFFVTGDFSAFGDAFAVPTPLVTFTFVPSSS